MKMKEELEKIRCEVEKLRVEKKNHVTQGFTFEKCRRAKNCSPQFAWRMIHSP